MPVPLTLYDNYTRSLRPFAPLVPGAEVGLYTCGPTVYDYQHIGNYRTFMFEDWLKRTLRWNGYAVRHVMNVTDVGHLTSDAVQQEWVRHGHMSPLRAAPPGSDAPLGQRRLLQFMQEAKTSALAPDVGFNLEVSDAFLDAVALVFGGRATPAQALADAERQVGSLREEETGIR